MPVKSEDYNGVCVIAVTGELAGDSAVAAVGSKILNCDVAHILRQTWFR